MAVLIDPCLVKGLGIWCPGSLGPLEFLVGLLFGLRLDSFEVGNVRHFTPIGGGGLTCLAVDLEAVDDEIVKVQHL